MTEDEARELLPAGWVDDVLAGLDAALDRLGWQPEPLPVALPTPRPHLDSLGRLTVPPPSSGACRPRHARPDTPGDPS